MVRGSTALGDRLAVHREPDVERAHARGSTSCAATRRSSTPARCFFTAPVAWMSSGRIEIERLHGVIDRAARQRGFGLARAHRRCADAEIDEPHVGQALAARLRGGRQARPCA